MIKGFRFTNQLANAEVDARIHQEFLNKNDGIFYGMDLSKTNNSITISEGLCEIAGRPVAVIGDEIIQVSDENLYCVLVLEIDLSKDSTKDTFNQVTFKLLTSGSSYSDVTQQDINKFSGTDKIYQLEFARFRSGTNGISDFKDTRKFLNFNGIYKKVQEDCDEVLKQIERELINVEVGNAQGLLQAIFPIGSTYVTQDNTNPNTILGFGTWERIKGKILIGLDENDEDFNEIGKIGGEKTHKIQGSELPIGLSGVRTSTDGSDWQRQSVTDKTSSQKAINMMPPYEVSGYMWIRRG